MPTNHKTAPIDDGSSRQIWIGWGTGIVCGILGLFPVGLFLRYTLLCLGAVLVLRGHRPGLFTTYIPAQIIAGVPARQEVSVKIWILALSGCMFLGGAAGYLHSKLVPRQSERPSVTIAAIALPDIFLKAGTVIVKWDIKNSVAGPLLTITEANLTLWYAPPQNPLPQKPNYIPTPSKLQGVTIAPGEIFEATFRADRELTERDLALINEGSIKLYALGYVKYRGSTTAEYSKGFAAVYKPKNDPRFGMFDHVEQPNYNYEY